MKRCTKYTIAIVAALLCILLPVLRSNTSTQIGDSYKLPRMSLVSASDIFSIETTKDKWAMEERQNGIDNSWLFTSSLDTEIYFTGETGCVSDLSTGRLIAHIDGNLIDDAYGFDISPNQKYITLYTTDKLVLYNDCGESTHEIALRNILSAMFISDNTLSVLASEELHFIEVGSGKIIKTLNATSGESILDFLNGYLFYSCRGSESNSVMIRKLNVESGTSESVYSFSARNTFAYSCNNGLILILRFNLSFTPYKLEAIDVSTRIKHRYSLEKGSFTPHWNSRIISYPPPDLSSKCSGIRIRNQGTGDVF